MKDLFSISLTLFASSIYICVHLSSLFLFFIYLTFGQIWIEQFF